MDLKAQLRLVSRAQRERWPMGDPIRKKIMQQAAIGLESDDPVTQGRAIKQLIELDKLNLRHEQIYASSATLDMNLEDMTEDQLDEALQMLESNEFNLANLKHVNVSQLINETPDTARRLSAGGTGYQC